MFAQALWFSAVIMGIDVGWQPLPEGGMEYIIQLDPQTIEALKAGEPIQSDIPPGAGNVRSYRIILGNKKLPRIGPPQTSVETPSDKTAERSKPPLVNFPDTVSPRQSTPLPRAFLPDQTEKPLTADPAAYVQPSEKKSDEKKEDLPPKPWMPLILVSLGLFASLGGNIYLTWIYADLRRRYQSPAAQIQSSHFMGHDDKTVGSARGQIPSGSKTAGKTELQ